MGEQVKQLDQVNPAGQRLFEFSPAAEVLAHAHCTILTLSRVSFVSGPQLYDP